jgi:hypothetical protein
MASIGIPGSVRSAEFLPFGQQLFGVRQPLAAAACASKAAKRCSILLEALQ